MAKNAVPPLAELTSKLVAGIDPAPTHGAVDREKLPDVGDDRSSSLSEVGERSGQEEIDNGVLEGSDANDTEAETERLEISPQKQRKLQNVLLTSDTGEQNDGLDPLELHEGFEQIRERGLYSPNDAVEPTSDISSLADSVEESDKLVSTSASSPRKRKRSTSEDGSASDQVGNRNGSLPKRVNPIRDMSASRDQNTSPVSFAEEDEDNVGAAVSPGPDGEIQRAQQSALSAQRREKGKRKAKKPEVETMKILQMDRENSVLHRGDHEELYSHEDDADVAGNGPEIDSMVKSDEEVIHKRTAMDALNAIEKCFATLRDKLFDERLTQCNDELAMLHNSLPTHPELIAMKDVVDQRRDQKLEYERTLTRFKLATLQRESVATKAQAHSQYMQTAREVRGKYLDQLNKEYYQLQRERRSVEGDVPDYLVMFTSKRSQQIRQQTAYNTEVALLSGIAKHVGFPAAPKISSVKGTDIDDDLRRMGIAPGAVHSVPNTSLSQRSSLPPTVSFPRQRSGADEYFLEQNPWANPQHPAHHQQRQQMHRQVSALSRVATPTATPAAQRRIVDLVEPQGSASTIAETQSGPTSSMVATPASEDATRIRHPNQSHTKNEKASDASSRKLAEDQMPDSSVHQARFEKMTDKSKALDPDKADDTHSPSLSRNVLQDNLPPASFPKSVPLMHLGATSSITDNGTPTPVRYHIKIEDSHRVSRRSPMSHQHHRLSTASSPMSRFAA